MGFDKDLLAIDIFRLALGVQTLSRTLERKIPQLRNGALRVFKRRII